MWNEIIAIILMCVGVVFFLGATVGVMRFPDFFTRIHAASKGDTLSSLCLVLGFAIYHLEDFSPETILVCLKLLLIVGFLFISTPTAAHALTEAAYASGARPWKKGSSRKKKTEGAE